MTKSISKQLNELPVNLGYITSTVPLPRSKRLKGGPSVTFEYGDFLQKLKSLNAQSSPTARLNELVSAMSLVRNASPKEFPVRAGCWIKKGKSYLHLVIGGDEYNTTAFSGKTPPSTPCVYINLAEWTKDNKRLDSCVHLRIDLPTHDGEWMWIRKSPCITGAEAVELATEFSRQFIRHAYMWDTAKITEKTASYALSAWSLIARETPELYYNKAGFQVIDTMRTEGPKERIFIQDSQIHMSAVNYVRNTKISTAATFIRKRESECLKKIAKKYGCLSGTLTTLCQRVQAAARKNLTDTGADRVFLYKLVTGAINPIKQGQEFQLAASIVETALILKASAPFSPVAMPRVSEKLFKTRVVQYKKANKALGDKNQFINWCQRTAISPTQK